MELKNISKKVVFTCGKMLLPDDTISIENKDITPAIEALEKLKLIEIKRDKPAKFVAPRDIDEPPKDHGPVTKPEEKKTPRKKKTEE